MADEWSPRCPMCGIEGASDEVQRYEDTVLVDNWCHKCEHRWTDVYAFSHREEGDGIVPAEVMDPDDPLFV